MSPEARWSARLLEIVSKPRLATEPERGEADGRLYAAYSASRFTLKSSAINGLPPNGLLLIQVRTPGEPIRHFILTRGDLEMKFERALKSRTWSDRGLYHWRDVPPAAWEFLVQLPERSPR
jgi:hypothetical protein